MILPFTHEEGSLLIKLLLAHFVGDFVLQTGAMVESKKDGVFKWGFLTHIAIVALLTFSAMGYSALPGVGFIVISHALLDATKVKLENRRINKHFLFAIDQLVHIAIIFIVWAFYIDNGIHKIGSIIQYGYFDLKILIYLLGYVIVTGPVTIIVKLMTDKWSKEMTKTNDGLREAGKWIGIIERMLIITFVFINQFVAIGFLIAAKSVLRLIDKPENLPDRKSKFSSRKHTEYVLIGTFLSFGFALVTGIVIAWILNLK